MEYAIDFGTSNTVVARINAEGKIETVKLPSLSRTVAGNPPLIPSLVYVENAKQGQILAGQAVSDRGLDTKNQSRFFQGFKRAIGNPVPGFVPELDEEAVEFETVGRWFLQKVIAQLPDIDSLILTVPVDSFEPYRQWLGTVCEQLDIKQIRLLDEPTAAALGYQLSEGQDTILVIDFGGGTLDLALVKIDLNQVTQTANQNTPFGFLLKWGDRVVKNPTKKAPIAKVIAKVGQNLGGIDIDNWLVDYFHNNQGLPRNSLVTRLIERIKIGLSTELECTEVFFDDETFNTYELSLKRAHLDEILEQNGFFTQLDTALDRVAQQAKRQGIDLEMIDAVLLVGGTAQIPAVQTWVAKHFPSEKIKGDKPFEAIAHGALSQGWELKDFLYHSYGVRYWDKRYQRQAWHTIIKSGQSYPLTEPVELVLGASVLDQPSIELVIGELGETDVEVYFAGDRLITRTLNKQQITAQPLNDREGARTLAKLEPLGKPGSDRIKVLFRVDEQRTLRITVEDLLTDRILVEDSAVVQLV